MLQILTILIAILVVAIGLLILQVGLTSQRTIPLVFGVVAFAVLTIASLYFVTQQNDAAMSIHEPR
jgi:uncharacterized membrane protein YedE/YeeE